MKKILSKQQNVLFIFCPSSITIDKSAEWGPNNFQEGPNGAFLKVNEDGPNLTISHLVQPNEDKTAPIGWVPSILGIHTNRFDKAPIWINTTPVPEGETVFMTTKDGDISYTAKEECYVCYNDLSGSHDLTDGWVQTRKDLEKNYYVTFPVTA